MPEGINEENGERIQVEATCHNKIAQASSLRYENH